MYDLYFYSTLYRYVHCHLRISYTEFEITLPGHYEITSKNDHTYKLPY